MYNVGAHDSDVCRTAGREQLIRNSSPTDAFSLINLDDIWEGDNGVQFCLADILGETSANKPQRQIIAMQLVEALGQAIDTLPEKERLALTLYYNEDFNIKEIGETLGLHEPQISQMIIQATVKIRKKLRLHRNKIFRSW